MQFKPGYLTDKAGSRLEFEVSTEPFAKTTMNSSSNSKSSSGTRGYNHTTLVRGSSLQMRLTYTSSYDGWGTARLSCVSGCTCSSQLINAVNDLENASVLKTKVTALHIPQDSSASAGGRSQPCRLQVRVLDETSSGGFKFKISQVTVRERVTDHK